MTYKNLQNLYLKTLLKRQQKIPNKEGPPQSLVKKKTDRTFKKKQVTASLLSVVSQPGNCHIKKQNRFKNRLARVYMRSVHEIEAASMQNIKLFFEFIQKRKNERAKSIGGERERSKNPRGQPHSSTSLRSLSLTLRCRYSPRALIFILLKQATLNDGVG